MFIQMKRKPTTVGEVLKEEYLIPLKMKQKDLATLSGINPTTLRKIVQGRAKLNLENAMRLAKVFGTTFTFWQNLQLEVDKYELLKDKEMFIRLNAVPTIDCTLIKGN